MVKWLNLCIPKDFGGLGIMETRIMNESLIAKWGWRVLKDDRNDLCGQLLKKKYPAPSGNAEEEEGWRGSVSISGRGLPILEKI